MAADARQDNPTSQSSASTDAVDGGWERHELTEVIDFQEGPGILAKDFRESGVPLIRLAGLDRDASVLRGCNYLDPEMVEARWQHFRVLPGDTLLSTSASLGRIAIVSEEAAGAIPYTGIIRFRPKDDRIVSEFIRYVLESRDFQLQAEAMGAGSVIRHFGPTHLRDMTLLLPPPEEQRAIAAVLGSLDDKVEQNRRTARTLERLARAIFKAWFVDFEPVKAKANGAASFPSMPQEVFDALPTAFADSHIGPVPEGWDVKAIAKIATFLNGLALQKYPPRGDGNDLRVIKIAQLRKGSTGDADWANGDVPEQYVIRDRDLLFSWSGTLEATLWFGGPGALNQHLFKVSSERYPSWFCLLWIRQHLPWFRAIAASKATTMGHIKRGHLQEAQVVVPPPPVLQAADEVLGSLYDLHAALMIESGRLGAMRDLLLPKLLSGEVGVRTIGKDNEG
ncbi:MAG: restriction endonuclease subunit S [Phycisphaerales bacterium]